MLTSTERWRPYMPATSSLALHSPSPVRIVNAGSATRPGAGLPFKMSRPVARGTRYGRKQWGRPPGNIYAFITWDADDPVVMAALLYGSSLLTEVFDDTIGRCTILPILTAPVFYIVLIFIPASCRRKRCFTRLYTFISFTMDYLGY